MWIALSKALVRELNSYAEYALAKAQAELAQANRKIPLLRILWLVLFLCVLAVVALSHFEKRRAVNLEWRMNMRKQSWGHLFLNSEAEKIASEPRSCPFHLST